MITCYRDLHAFLRLRANQVRMSRERIDELAGLPRGYAATLLAENGAKRMSLEVALAIAGTLGLGMDLLEDPEAMAKIKDSIGSRVEGKVTASRRSTRERKRKKLLRDLLKQARVQRNIKLTPAERSRIASVAATARWKPTKRRRRGGGSSLKRSNPCPKSVTAVSAQTDKALRLNRSN